MKAVNLPRSREQCERLDSVDPLAQNRALFEVPHGLVYLDGNSLGALTTAARRRVEAMVREEWGHGLIRSWNDHHWFSYPERLGWRIAPLIGAEPDEVLVADSTTVNLFKLAASAALGRGRRAAAGAAVRSSRCSR